MRLIEIIYNHAQFDELPPERIFAPLGFEVHTQCHEHPDLDTPVEFGAHDPHPTACIDSLPFDPPEGFVEIARYKNEDCIVLLALKPITALAEILLAQIETGEALAAIARERRRQVEVECWTPEHDDEHDDGSLAAAAGGYALTACLRTGNVENEGDGMGLWWFWPWHEKWWKPSSGPHRNLVKAGALILAENERLERQAGITHESLPSQPGPSVIPEGGDDAAD